MKPWPYPTLMVQGCTSDAGKSTVVAALCRLLSDAGYRVAPFKPQNMALNSAVTEDGGEIGRAQALQALAARVPPHTDMNPVLLKPSSDTGAQVIIHGKVRADMNARDYHQYKTTAMSAVLESYARLQAKYDVVMVEGAGSPAEINLRERDIANMGFAEAVDCPVILVADIDKGGVFAHLVGTLACLSESERNRVIGFVINKFRGDISLLQGGLDWIEAQTGKPVLAVLPMLHGLMLDAEDAVQSQQERGDFNIVVPVLPRISNHTDFDALRAHPGVNLHFVGPDAPKPPADLVILPGSKNTRADLAFLQAQGWPQYLQRHLRYGGKLLGICGGYQMLGQHIHDPLGVEGKPGSSAGLGYLAIDTTLAADKTLTQRQGRFVNAAAKVSGYEIHMGVSHGPDCERPVFMLDDGSVDGAVSPDGMVMGSYLHGLFDHPDACQTLLKWAGMDNAEGVDLAALRETSIARLAAASEELVRKLAEMNTRLDVFLPED